MLLLLSVALFAILVPLQPVLAEKDATSISNSTSSISNTKKNNNTINNNNAISNDNTISNNNGNSNNNNNSSISSIDSSAESSEPLPIALPLVNIRSLTH